MKKWIAFAAFAAVALSAGAFLALESSWLRREIERRVVAELREQTKTDVEIGGFSFDWRRLTLEAAPLIVHGTESPDKSPLLRVERIRLGMGLDLRSRSGVRVRSLEMERPVAAIYVTEDGKTNLPEVSDGPPLPEALLNFELSRLEVREGELRWNERRVPVDIRASNVSARADFAAAAREYRGFVAADRIDGAALPIGARVEFALSASRLNVTSASIRAGNSSVTASGELSNWEQIAGRFDSKISADLAELSRLADVPQVRGGVAAGELVLLFDTGGTWRAEGRIRSTNLAATVGGEELRDAAFDARLVATPDAVRLDDAIVRAMGGEFHGSAAVTAQSKFTLRGEVRGVEIPGRLAAKVFGEISGSGTVRTLNAASAKLRLEPTAGDVPVAGSIDASYDGVNVLVSRSVLRFGGSEVKVSGQLRNGLALSIRTSDLGDLIPALRLWSADVPRDFPLSLEGRPAEFDGVLAGPADAPRLSGRWSAARLRIEGQTVENVSADGEVSVGQITLRRAALERNGARAAFSGSTALTNWRLTDDSAIHADGRFEAVNLAAFAKELGAARVSISGTAHGTASVRGTVLQPSVSGEVHVVRGEVGGEAFDRASAKFEADRERVRLSGIDAARGSGRVQAEANWTPANTRFSASARDWDISSHAAIGERVVVSGRAEGAFDASNGQWKPAQLTAAFDVRAQSSGTLAVKALTQDGDLNVSVQADILGAAFTSESKWKLEPGLPGGGTVRIVSLTESAIARAAGAGPDTVLPFSAAIDGGGTFTGKLSEPTRLAAEIRLSTVRLTPRQLELPAGVTASDLTIRNVDPVVLAAGASGVVIRQARFAAKETELEAAGNVAFRRADQMNFLLRGNVNLAVLDAFNPDIAAAGKSTLNLRVRGPLKIPRLDGRLAFENAAFNLRGFPNGLENVNGAVIFDRNRASVDGLRGQSGGGGVLLNGYVGFGSELSYQLQLALNKVRVRYPEGVSTQANALLVLTGTAKRSLLSGSVTVLRAGLSPATDVGGLLAVSPPASPAAEGAPDFRRGLQLDLRLETAQSAQFATELTKNVEADVDVRVRGTALRPVVLGRVSVTRGTVQFFGTDYAINRGEVNFVNPVSIEPQVDLDLETRVRGILVSVSFAGPLNRMSMSYRSDPPLQSSEILALLAVGRTPSSATAMGLNSVRGQDLLSAGGTAMLSSALSQGSAANNNLQRFFGVTRLKIDPQLIGLDNTPQSRISFEQPISRDVTVTYSQTLARAQGQLVRVQWDLNRQWSALLTRDENGIVSVDFVYRRSF